MGDANKDLVELARTTTEDLYTLLSVPFDADEALIKRAYRKASIKYHPDKNPDNKDAADRFIYLGWARDILADEQLKGEYDRARARRREKVLQDELLSGTRRRMKEDLERREREGRDAGLGLKRKRAQDLSEAEKREHEIHRLAEDGKRRRKEAQARMEQRLKDEQDEQNKQDKQDDANSPEEQQQQQQPQPQPPPRPGDTPEIHRTIKIRFQRDTPATTSWDKPQLAALFSKYGAIESVVVAKDKKLRESGAKHRKVLATAFIIYARVDHAHAAVLDATTDFPALQSAAWASLEPDLTSPVVLGSGNENSSSNNNNSNNTTTTNTTNPSAPSTPVAKSFRASFGPGIGLGRTTPLGTPKFSFSPKTPSLEEVTMMRLKQAEKKRLEDQIRKAEAEAEADEESKGRI